MPKPRGKWNQEHRADFPKRRVSFKQQRGNGQKNFAVKHLDRYEDDLSYITQVNRPKGNRYQRGRRRTGSPVPNKRLFVSSLNWYRVNIPYGGKYDKAVLLKKILDHLTPMPLIPYMYVSEGRNAYFYIEDHKVAEKLYKLNKEIEMPDGFKLLMRVQADMPNVDVTAELRDKMKLAMAKRYNSESRALDMTKFHADPDLQDNFCPLFKPVVTLAVINIIHENIPDLQALSLNDNNIQILSHLKDLPKKLPNLKILHLARNKLKNINTLDNFTTLPLVEIVLTGNPLCDSYKDQASYVSDVRKRFSKLERLDGVDLPPAISFDVEDVPVPTTKQTFLVNQEGQVLIRQFLEEYFKVMDSGDRKALMQAYHPNALLSMTMSYGYGQNPKNSAQLNWYNNDNRNLERVTDPERRRKLLKQGQLSVMNFIEELPTTQHDMNSLTVDLCFFTPTMLLLNVTGLFKELRTGRKVSPLRYFFRTFVVVPSGAGFCIVNEELHVTNATEVQSEKAFATTPATIVSTVPPPQYSETPSTSTTDVAGTPPVTIPDATMKEQMINSLRMETGMNVMWATKCLEETNWTYHLALFAYNEAKNLGSIPADAFV